MASKFMMPLVNGGQMSIIHQHQLTQPPSRRSCRCIQHTSRQQASLGETEPCAVAARTAARRKALQAEAAGVYERELAAQSAHMADFEGPDMREVIQDRARPQPPTRGAVRCLQPVQV